jgi:hypothetical protein
MAIVMSLEWPGTTVEDYDRVMEALGLDEQAPSGGVFHVCGADGDTIRTLDIWQSEDDWNAFRDNRLMPALAQTGMLEKGAPDVRTYPLHNVYAPMIDELRRMGSSSTAGAVA